MDSAFVMLYSKIDTKNPCHHSGKHREPCHSSGPQGTLPPLRTTGNPATLQDHREPCHHSDHREPCHSLGPQGALPLLRTTGSPAAPQDHKEPCHPSEPQGALPLLRTTGNPATPQNHREPCYSLGLQARRSVQIRTPDTTASAAHCITMEPTHFNRSSYQFTGFANCLYICMHKSTYYLESKGDFTPIYSN